MNYNNITIKDVAKAANVSTATVSNVISKTKYVSPELAKRVTKVIKQVNYKPSKIARSLKVNKTFYIGLIVPDITNPFFAEVVRGAEVAPRMKEADLEKYFNSIPFVIADRPLNIKNYEANLVYADNIKSSYQLAKHLIKKGHQSFAYIAGPREVLNVQKRIFGFSKGLKDSGFSEEKNVILYGEFNYENGFKLMNKILELKPHPTAVFALSDITAWGALESAKAKGLNIPEDIAIAGFDNVYFSKLLNPSLTTIHQPKYELGRVAVNILIKKLNNMKEGLMKKNEIILESKLILRNST
jgi:LacI family transcriptional regulator